MSLQEHTQGYNLLYVSSFLYFIGYLINQLFFSHRRCSDNNAVARIPTANQRPPAGVVVEMDYDGSVETFLQGILPILPE